MEAVYQVSSIDPILFQEESSPVTSKAVDALHEVCFSTDAGTENPTSIWSMQTHVEPRASSLSVCTRKIASRRLREVGELILRIAA